MAGAVGDLLGVVEEGAVEVYGDELLGVRLGHGGFP
jgi:hypothetical protein